MRRTVVTVHESWAPRNRARTFCGLEREDWAKVHWVLTGRRMPPDEEAAEWRDRQVFRSELKRRLAQTGTCEVS